MLVGTTKCFKFALLWCMILCFSSQVRPTAGFGGWIGLLVKSLGLVRSLGHQVRRVCRLVVLSGCIWPEKRSGTRRRVFFFSSIASSASSLSFHCAIRAHTRDMRRDVTTCGAVTTATSTATVASAGRDRMARCGVWVGLSRDRPPHMPLDLTCKPSISRHTRRGSTSRAGAVAALRP